MYACIYVCVKVRMQKDIEPVEAEYRRYKVFIYIYMTNHILYMFLQYQL